MGSLYLEYEAALWRGRRNRDTFPMHRRLHSTLAEAGQALGAGGTSSQKLVAAALARADAAHASGLNCIVERAAADSVLAAAQASDARRAAGKTLGPLDGALPCLFRSAL